MFDQRRPSNTVLGVHTAEELSFERFYDREKFRSMSCQVRTTTLKVRGNFALRGAEWMSWNAETRRTKLNIGSMVRNVINLANLSAMTFLQASCKRGPPDVVCRTVGGQTVVHLTVLCLSVVPHSVGKRWGESADLSPSYGKTAALNKDVKQPYLLSLTQITSALCLSDVVFWLSAEDGSARDFPPLQ